MHLQNDENTLMISHSTEEGMLQRFTLQLRDLWVMTHKDVLFH